jgi:hypothetical protein
MPPTLTIPAPTLISARRFSHYRFRAVVDWIELKIVTATPTNFPTVRARLGIPFARSLDAGDGGAATIFRVTIHDPKSWADIEATLDGLTEDHPLAAEVEVTGIEIALDAYSERRSRDDLVDMTVRFYRNAEYLIVPGRLGRLTGETLPIEDVKMLGRAIDEGFNVYIGHRRDPLRQHMYLKETDNNGQSLPDVQHRARTEITLEGEHLPVRLLEDWKRFRFTEMAGRFKYRELKPDDELNPYVRAGMKIVPQIGEQRVRRRAPSGIRLHSPSTRADSELNSRAFDAFRELDRRMKG